MEIVQISAIDRGSYSSFCIKLLSVNHSDGSEIEIGTGTGFIYLREGRTCLVTNWHVLTGRNPTAPGMLLDGYHNSPSRMVFHLTAKANKHEVAPARSIDLYEDGQPVWYEAKNFRCSIDLVFIPMDFPEQLRVVPVNSFESFGKKTISIQDEVVIIGFPFGFKPDIPFPVWKRAAVATEPSLTALGKLAYLLDSPGRPGMSGSPVFKFGKGLTLPSSISESLTKSGKEFSLDDLGSIDVRQLQETNVLDFVGIYSGSIGDKSLSSMNLGICWHSAALMVLFEKPIKGHNPFPP